MKPSADSENTTAQIKVYDPAMCCSTGVCGPSVDPMLVRFAADLQWLQEQGVQVERFNLSQTPIAFVENERVKHALTEKGETALPMIIANGQVASSGRYPEREELAAWAGLTLSHPSAEPDTCCGATPDKQGPGESWG